MVICKRKVHDIELFVCVEKELYNNGIKVFNCLFSTFEKIQLDSVCNYTSKNLMYIFSCENYLNNQQENIKYIICNMCDPNWVLNLVGLLEEWYAEVMGCTIIHGSCIRIWNKNILMIGKRKAGKTTLTSYFVINHSASYLDDDCVYFLGSEYIGFNMPIAVRKNVDGLPLKEAICTSYDVENTKRILFRAPKNIDSISNVDIIVFLEYNNNNINELTRVQSSIAFNTIIKNIRNSKNMKSLFQDICKISKHAQTYNLSYTTSENAYKLLDVVIGKESRE